MRDGDLRDERLDPPSACDAKTGPGDTLGPWAWQGSRGGGSSLGERQRCILALFLPLPVQRDAKTQINKIATSVMASILGVQSTLCSPSHPHPRPQKEPPPIPALPCCSSCCYPSLLLHFRESPPSFALFPIASPTASPLRQHHHHHHPPLPPRPRRHPTSSSSSPLLTRTSLLQTLLVPARKRPLSLPHHHPPPPLSPYRGASHPSFLSQKSPLTEHNNPTPTARPLGLLCARCAPILHISVPPPQDHQD